MYGRSSRYGPSGSSWGQPPQQTQSTAAPNLNPSFSMPNLNVYIQAAPGVTPHPQNFNFPLPNTNFVQNSNFQVQNPIHAAPGVTPHPQNFNFPLQNTNFIQNSNFQVQNPSFPSQTYHNSRPQFHNSAQNTKELLEKIDCAVAKARSDVLAAGESVSAWKVSQLALLILQADSWSSLGFRMQEVPALHRLIVTEGKVNAFVHCFVGVRRITSLYDLEVAICKNEGIEKFEELELGPLLRHPLIQHYFSVPLESTEVIKITSEEIIYSLCEFMDTHKLKDVDFLDFIAKNQSVERKELLGVRLQSLGMHISAIKEARNSENATLKKCMKLLKLKSNKERKRRPLFAPQKQKQKLDERFSVISQRVKSFSSSHTDFCGQHIRFDSSSSQDEDSYDYTSESEKNDSGSMSNLSLQSNRTSEQVSSCPYPSAIEEMMRLGFKSRTSPSKKKRKIKSGNLSFNMSGPCKSRKRGKIEQDTLPTANGNDTDEVTKDSLKIPNDSLMMFITTWKDACRDNNVTEVFERMLQFVEPKAQQRKKIKHMFSLYPFIGLLNVAVSSIKAGMWNSVYDTIQTISHNELTNASGDKSSGFACIDVEPNVKDRPVTMCISDPTDCISIDDIMTKIEKYIEIDHEIQNSDKLVSERRMLFLKKLRKCEFWLAEQFSVKDFKSLGYGDFFTFLEKHTSLLPKELYKFLMADVCERSPFKACILQHQLVILVSQSLHNLRENETITKEMISTLLARQFPFISFKLSDNGSLEDFLETIEKQKDNVVSKCVIFSTTLLGRSLVGDSLTNNDICFGGVTSAMTDNDLKARGVESISSRDAIRILIKAPMLLDLNLWSHWDSLFAPSLGPLVPWLLNEVNAEELLCLVTKEGKVMRIDHTATVDSFLEAALQGSSFQTAVKLLSLFSLAGGGIHVPLSLLKCHAHHAFEVILKNYIESVDLKEQGNFVGHGKLIYGQNISNEVATSNLNSKLHESFSKMEKAVPILSRFVIDCLGYIPAEFRCFAADVLLSGLQLVVKTAASDILHECNQPEQRLMLHEVGFSLGIVEWINDHHSFCMADTSKVPMHEVSCLNDTESEISRGSNCMEELSASEKTLSVEDSAVEKSIKVGSIHKAEINIHRDAVGCEQHLFEFDEIKDAALVIESIRCDEFGLDPNLHSTESRMLMKQHARLGRALHCLSQELYSQDSHFLLELVQNADDNIYTANVEPTLTFILQESGIIVLNNEQGFSAQNIKALCDVGNSTKKGSNAGYIGQKGIGFKSVFRVTDAPEIHSNGFHIKFDISEGQIGFVLPTVVPPCNIDLYCRLVFDKTDKMDINCWKTCIVLPFRSRLLEGTGLNSIMSMFSDLHPSLLLFLHRLQCIKFRNLLNDSLIVMRKEIVGDGIVKVSHGKEKMTWLVVSKKLRTEALRRDVQSTEISVAFTLQEADNGAYSPYLDQQPVFAFLPLRAYGLKFILQGDFVLPSSREEVDGNSPWNQWLLSEFPSLFVSAEKSFCGLSCFRGYPGKAVAAYMSFVPLIGEVHGFFSSLPRLIISKLRMSSCLVLEGNNDEWVPPCKVLRGWNEQACVLLPQHLLHEHLGLGFLDKFIVLPDPIAKALGIEEYGPKILVQFLSSLCQKENNLKSMGLKWLGSWLNELYMMLFHSSGQNAPNLGIEIDLITVLRKVPFIPLSDGTYGSVEAGTIWLHSDSLSSEFSRKHGLENFPNLNAKLHVVFPALLSTPADDNSGMNTELADNITRMLHRIGVQRLSAHEIIKVHILPALSDEEHLKADKNLMTEYVCFIMIHLLSSCHECQADKEYMISELRNKALILTNHGFRKPVEVSIHFSKEYGNPININKFNAAEMKWHEVDTTYLKHPVTESISSGLTKWRNFFLDIGVTDFVRVVAVDKDIADISHMIFQTAMWDKDLLSLGSVVKDYESHELVDLLSQLSTNDNRDSCKYLLEILDSLWDDCFSDKVAGYCSSNSGCGSQSFKSSFMSSICDVRWVVSSFDGELHFPKDLFLDCDTVRPILGACAPYAVPKVRSAKLVRDIGFKTRVTLDDMLDILKLWRTKIPFKTCISQMSAFYSFLWGELAHSKQKSMKELYSGSFIFVPNVSCSNEDVVPGLFLSPEEVYWYDSTGCLEKMKDVHAQNSSPGVTNQFLIKTLCNIYPGLHNFFVDVCGVHEFPPLRSYIQILRQLSTVALPSQAANAVFQVLLKWSDGLKSGLLSSEDISYLKECLMNSEFVVLPTVQDKWVSLHPSFGLVCWCDDKKLRKQFKNMDNIDFLYFGEVSKDEKEMFQMELSSLMKTLGIPALSEIITREAIYYGLGDSTLKASLLNWALPYAQRYLCSVHPDKYAWLKQSGFDVINSLQIIVVEKLYFRNIIKSCGVVSEKRVECSCLLQDNTLYATQESDSHALFMELSCLLFGKPELHLANFLHMITTMAESGSSEEQTEVFILNSQKVTKLPEEEPVWSLSIVPSLMGNDNLPKTGPASTTAYDQAKMKERSTSKWPSPADWKTAPDFSYARAHGFKTQAAISQPQGCSYEEYGSEDVDEQTDDLVPITVNTDWALVENSLITPTASAAEDPENLEDNQTDDHVDLDPVTAGPQLDSCSFKRKDQQLRIGTPNPVQAIVTGRVGELVAFKYFLGKVNNNTVVKWVNEDVETGLPYDILIGDNESNREYIEVKATKSSRKDWFNISTREWQFAIEKGESFSVAHIVLLGNNTARVSVFKNPVKLCQLSKLQLAVIMPRQQNDFSIAS